MAATVRVSERAHASLAMLAAETGQSMTAVLDDAISNYEQRVFWRRFAAAMERTAADPDAWAEVAAERAELETTLRDGLDDDVPPDVTPGQPA